MKRFVRLVARDWDWDWDWCKRDLDGIEVEDGSRVQCASQEFFTEVVCPSALLLFTSLLIFPNVFCRNSLPWPFIVSFRFDSAWRGSGGERRTENNSRFW